MCKKHNALKSHGVIDRIEHRKSEDYSMLRPSIGIDWDDVTAPFNSIAIRMANENIIRRNLIAWRKSLPGPTKGGLR